MWRALKFPNTFCSRINESCQCVLLRALFLRYVSNASFPQRKSARSCFLTSSSILGDRDLAASFSVNYSATTFLYLSAACYNLLLGAFGLKSALTKASVSRADRVITWCSSTAFLAASCALRTTDSVSRHPCNSAARVSSSFSLSLIRAASLFLFRRPTAIPKTQHYEGLTLFSVVLPMIENS